ncbi:LysR family transcriptional regulator [Kribbella sandramycini]|uniref:DNA-binding transcriptional LysR family regulator n=1 Tax=Kribbella sandramycini TaxID=60450 RepID=A0A7Y4NY19_9ACTN|nr:LysR family transcriptional regulator [Kribbella sandramycini]MBB6567317.1 DNA-binding transcriptional LysR family regulator [Kribbella sandramycini]NOL40071.1 LysR family transcriptional regulator [Kribbella sandramycini]
MMDLGRLRALYAVAQYGSINRAADVLGYTPSAVSQQLAKLERETRTTLIERQGRGIALTDAARELAATAARILELVEDAELTLEEHRGEAIGTLRIAAFATSARGLLPTALGRLIADHPGLDVRLTETDPYDAVAAVSRGESDIAIVHDWQDTPLTLPEGLTRVKLGSDPADVLVHSTHRLAGKEFVRAQDLVGERWICQVPGSICHDWLVRTMRRVGVEPDVACSVAEYQTQLALLAEGIGIALIPRLGRGPVPDEVVVVPLQPAPSRRIYAVWREITSRRPAIAVTLSTLKRAWPERATA